MPNMYTTPLLDNTPQSQLDFFNAYSANFDGLNDTLHRRGDRELALLANDVYDACAKFLVDNRIITGDRAEQALNRRVTIGTESISSGFTPKNMRAELLRDLVVSSGVVPANKVDTATMTLASLLFRAKTCSDNRSFIADHYESYRNRSDREMKLGWQVYPQHLANSLRQSGKLPGQEAFGANIDTVIPDLRAAMAVTLLQFHQGICDRVLHRRTNGTPYVRYVVPYAEVYDVLKSNNADHNIRNEGDHYEPFINLYGDPRSVSNQLQPIIPLVANDTDGNKLVSDGFVKFGARDVNLFDLAAIPNQLGKSHYNLTDLVSENVALDTILLKLSDGTTTELFKINVRQINGARLNMVPNTNDSGIRGTIFGYTFKLTKDSVTASGAKTTLLSKCTDTDFLRCHISATVTINLKYAQVDSYGAAVLEGYNIANGAVSSDVTTLLEGMTVSLEGFSLDACYSEENLRKTNLAIRSNVRTFDFEISNGRNILVDYSFQEELPEFLMSLVTATTALGQDHRALDVIIAELKHVFDETHLEDNTPGFRNKLDTIGFQYIASQLVRPVVYMNTIDLDYVESIRSSDFLGDIRQYVEWQLMNLTSLIYQNSFYKQQLSPGEAPKFKVITSNVILDNILSIPHIHNHLNHDTAPTNGNSEYVRVLPNGTILDCVTTTFNYMRDKIIMIPYRDDNPESLINFGHNWDYGTFVAHYNPQIDNAVNKRVFANSRTMVIPTCPIGIYLDVKNISNYIDMFQVTNPRPNGSTLPSPSDILAQQGA